MARCLSFPDILLFIYYRELFLKPLLAISLHMCFVESTETDQVRGSWERVKNLDLELILTQNQ